MHRALFLVPFLLAACGGAEAPTSFAAGSPADTASPSGHRVPVATVLDAADPAAAARSPLLAVPAAAPAMDHSHHHHGTPPAATSTPSAAPTVDHSKHNHGTGGNKP